MSRRPAPRVRGFVIESRATTIRSVPQADFDPPPGLGILLEIATLVPAASDAFTPEELAERIAWHAARVAREEAAIFAGQTRGPAKQAKRKPLSPDWKTCRCAGCSCRLFGESMRDVPGLPPIPFVAGRVDDRPYCRECLWMQRRPLVRAEGVDGTVAMIPADRIPF